MKIKTKLKQKVSPFSLTKFSNESLIITSLEKFQDAKNKIYKESKKNYFEPRFLRIYKYRTVVLYVYTMSSAINSKITIRICTWFK